MNKILCIKGKYGFLVRNSFSSEDLSVKSGETIKVNYTIDYDNTHGFVLGLITILNRSLDFMENWPTNTPLIIEFTEDSKVTITDTDNNERPYPITDPSSFNEFVSVVKEMTDSKSITKGILVDATAGSKDKNKDKGKCKVYSVDGKIFFEKWAEYGDYKEYIKLEQTFYKMKGNNHSPISRKQLELFLRLIKQANKFSAGGFGAVFKTQQLKDEEDKFKSTKLYIDLGTFVEKFPIECHYDLMQVSEFIDENIAHASSEDSLKQTVCENDLEQPLLKKGGAPIIAGFSMALSNQRPESVEEVPIKDCGSALYACLKNVMNY